MNNDELKQQQEIQEFMKKELSYSDEQLNKIYRITEEGSEEEYEAETELHKDLLAIRLAEKDPLKFEKYFKNANRNDVLNNAYQMNSVEKSNFALINGDLFNYDNDFEKTIIDAILRTIKKRGFLQPLNVRKLINDDSEELAKLLNNEANSIMVADAVCAELRNRYDLEFRLFTKTALNRKEYGSDVYNINQFKKNYNNDHSANLGGYSDFLNKIEINTTLHNKSYGGDHIFCQQNLLKTLYHEVRHAIMFNRAKGELLTKQDYIMAKNLEYVAKHPFVYKLNHDFFESEIDANDFAEIEVMKDYKDSKIKILNDPILAANRYTKKYDQLNNVTTYSSDPYINALASLESFKLDKLIKFLYADNFISYEIKCYLVEMCIKNHTFNGINKLNGLELRYLKGMLEDIRKGQFETLKHVMGDSKHEFVKNNKHYSKQIDKVNKIEKKIK